MSPTQPAPKRSDLVRQRRSQTSRRHYEQVTERITRTTVVPPVVSRSPMTGIPARQKVNSRPRRQVYYALSTPGAEVRLPALPAIQPGWRLLSGFMVICLLAALFALWNLPTFQLTAARLVGGKRITAHDINAVLDVSEMRSFEVSPGEMESELRAAFPDLSSVSVRVGFPASLVVTIQERTPLLIWQEGDKTLWIDQNGVAFPPRGDTPEGLVTVEGNAPASSTASPTDITSADASVAGQTAASPLAPVSSTESKPFISPTLIPAILAMKSQAPAGVALAYDDKYGLGWNDPKGWKVYFGFNETDMGLKLQEYQAIVSKLESEGIQPKLISVEYIHAPFYRLEP
jgi:cell division protein FtsQ